MSFGPEILLNRPESDPDYIWLSRVNSANDFCVFLQRDRSKRRRVSANDSNSGIPFLQIESELFHHFRRPSTVQKMTIPGSDGALAKLQHKIGTIDPIHVSATHEPADPYQGHPVGGNHACTIINFPQLVIPYTFNDAVDRRSDYVVGLATSNPFFDLGNSHLHIDGTDPYAQHVRALHFVRLQLRSA